MAELVKTWNDGGTLTVTYDGSSEGSAVFSSDTAEGLDREMNVSFVDKNRSVFVERTVRQEGLREVFMASDGDFLLADGGTFNVLKAPKYQQVEYIESVNADAYIDTEFRPTYKTKVVADVSDIPASAAFVYGVRDTSSGTSPRQFAFYRRTASTIRAYYFGTNTGSVVSDTMPRATIVQDKNTISAYGVTLTNTAVSSGICNNTLYIFAMNDAGSATGLGNMKLYSCQIYDDGVLVRDYIPVIYEGRAGLLDKLADKFYPSAGSGEFVAGDYV